MKGIFVNSILGEQGITDFGYYIDDGDLVSSPEEVEEMVENNTAYAVKIKRVLNGDVHIILSSADREVSAKLEEEVGLKTRGLESTIYQRTGDPVIPSHYEDREKCNETLTVLAEYALNHGGEGIIVEDVDWDSLL